MDGNMDPLILARALIIYFLLVTLNGMIQGKQSIKGFFALKESHDLLFKTVEDLKNENETLETEITRITESADYANKVLRDKFHLVEENEELIFFDD